MLLKKMMCGIYICVQLCTFYLCMLFLIILSVGILIEWCTLIERGGFQLPNRFGCCFQIHGMSTVDENASSGTSFFFILVNCLFFHLQVHVATFCLLNCASACLVYIFISDPQKLSASVRSGCSVSMIEICVYTD